MWDCWNPHILLFLYFFHLKVQHLFQSLSQFLTHSSFFRSSATHSFSVTLLQFSFFHTHTNPFEEVIEDPPAYFPTWHSSGWGASRSKYCVWQVHWNDMSATYTSYFHLFYIILFFILRKHQFVTPTNLQRCHAQYLFIYLLQVKHGYTSLLTRPEPN